VRERLSKTSEAHPLLAIFSSVVYILISLSCVVALSFALLVISFTVPSIAIYLVLPLMLILMLLLGSGFIYRFFGNKLPFVNEDLQ
jgi:ABC-type polysaccharide/polyol phosphate export permease